MRCLRLKIFLVVTAVVIGVLASAVPAFASHGDIFSIYSGKCIDSPSGTNGQLIEQWTCNLGNNQYWVVHQYSNGSYYAENQYYGKCMGIPNGNSGSQVYVLPCMPWDPGQEWWLTQRVGSNGEVGYIFKNAFDGLCLDLRAWSTANGAAIEQYKCLNQDNQTWAIAVF